MINVNFIWEKPFFLMIINLSDFTDCLKKEVWGFIMICTAYELVEGE